MIKNRLCQLAAYPQKYLKKQMRPETPQNRPPYHRLRRIIAMVRDGMARGRLPNRSDFRRELEVSPRTLSRDLDFLRDEESAPIAYEPARHGYLLTDATYDLPPVNLSRRDWKKPVAVEVDVPVQVPQTDDEFEGDRLGLQWQWQANPAANWCSLSARPGWLRLHAQPLIQKSLALVLGVLMQKFPARTFCAETLVDCTSCHAEAGLVVMGGGETATLGVSNSAEGR